MKIFIGIVIALFIILAIPYFYKTLQLKTLTKSDLPKEGNWANLSSGNIYYQWHSPTVEANGEIIILVHGFSTPSFVWKGILEDLQSSGFKILAYDHFGRGFSSVDFLRTNSKTTIQINAVNNTRFNPFKKLESETFIFPASESSTSI